MRMSIERSNGSHSRLRVSVSSWSRDEHPVGVLDEHAQQVELHAGDRQLRAVLVGQLVRGEIEHAAADLDPLRRPWPAAAGFPRVRRSTLFRRARSSRGSKGLAR